MKRLNAMVCWVNAVGYSMVTAAAVVLHAWCLVVMCILAIIISHASLLKAEASDGLHGTPKDSHQ